MFYQTERKGENSNLWKGFANQKRIWKCWQMVVSPDVRRRCWLESVSSVSLQIFSLLKYSFFNFQSTFKFQVGPSYNLHWFYCTFSTVHCFIKCLQILRVKTLLQIYTAFTYGIYNKIFQPWNRGNILLILQISGLHVISK